MALFWGLLMVGFLFLLFVRLPFWLIFERPAKRRQALEAEDLMRLPNAGQRAVAFIAEHSAIEGMSRFDYERRWLGLLTKSGRSVRLPNGSGDHGADLISLRIAVQQDGKPAGKGEVQEVIDVMKLEEAEFGALVSNTGFSPAAKELAHKSGVALLHHSELDRLDQMAVQARRARPT